MRGIPARDEAGPRRLADARASAVIEDGVEAVSAQRLSHEPGLTRGSFCGYFGSRGALLDRLLQRWRNLNTRALRRIAARERTDVRKRIQQLIRMWIEDDDR